MTGNFLGATPAAGTIGPVTAPTFGQQFAASPAGGGIQKLIGEPTITNQAGEVVTKGSGFRGLGTGEKLGLTLAGTSLLGEDEKMVLPPGTKPEDYEKAKKKADEQLADILSTYDYEGEAAGVSPYSYQSGDSLYKFNKGGIAEVKKFNQGGINYLPSKSDHDEKDYNNYIRAEGYVEDGSGNGDKDEDTMLAQLADGEFVSRADAILGAGIMEGANPSSYKDMRKKGAAFFYGQQAKFKRIFDLLDAAREKKN